MRLEQLEYLVVISKCKSLSEASKRLFITQQSLGKSITNLEKELGVTLLTRTSRGGYLTKEGLEVLDAAKGILQQIDQLKGRFSVCPEITGDITMLCCPAVHETVLSGAIDELSRRAPHMNVMALAKDSFLIPDMHRRLSECSEGTIVSVLNVPDDNVLLKSKISDDLEFLPLVDDYWVTCMNKNHPLAMKMNLTLKSLFNEPLIIEYPDYPEAGIDRITLDYYRDYGTPQIKKIVDCESLFYSTIENSTYIGFASHFFVAHSANIRPNVIFKDFTPTINSQIGCLFRKKDRDNESVRTFAKCLKEHLYAD